MTKKELMTGNVVEDRMGNKYIYLNGVLMCDGVDTYSLLSSYDDDLKFTTKTLYGLDIMKVYTTNALTLEDLFKPKHLTLIWQRKE